MNSLDRWEPCLADSMRGIAFFDGITIETDRITDPRWDRVLPILEEEQVFMCRMMAPLLQANSNAIVLDIGTGSGVFAIRAAKLGCRVVAIDISPRALRFARQNTLKNGIKIASSEPKPGEIQFLQRCFKDMDIREKFDFVLMSPPYNPTCKEFRPALHAGAGLLGQDCFNEQLPYAAGLLKEGGVCIGNHMMLVDTSGTKLPDSCSNVAGEFRYLPILSETISVKKFVSEQYVNYRNEKLKLKPTWKIVQNYIELLPKDDLFTLVYFELHSLSTDLHKPPLKIKPCDDVGLPPQGWKERINLHRLIIEHTSLGSSFPAPALFLGIDALPDFSSPKDTNSDSPWNNSILRYIDSWLAKTGILDPEVGFFDLLLIDTAPWFPDEKGLRVLNQEAAVWMASKATGEQAKTFLAAYQQNTLRLQETYYGPYLHSCFTGAFASEEWRSIQVTVNDAYQNPEVRVNNLVEEWAENIKRAPIAEADLQKAARSCGEAEDPKCAAVVMYAHSKIEEVGVSTKLDNNEKKKAAEEVRFAQIKEALKLNDKAVRNWDLIVCHCTMHHLVDDLLPAASECTRELQKRTSFLFGIPVSITSLDYELGNGLETPEGYRGGVWVYAVTRGNEDWSLAAEQFLLDLARLLNLLYQRSYSFLFTRPRVEDITVERAGKDTEEGKAALLVQSLLRNYFAPYCDMQQPLPGPNEWKTQDVWGHNWCDDWSTEIVLKVFGSAIHGDAVKALCIRKNEAIDFRGGGYEVTSTDLKIFLQKLDINWTDELVNSSFRFPVEPGVAFLCALKLLLIKISQEAPPCFQLNVIFASEETKYNITISMPKFRNNGKDGTNKMNHENVYNSKRALNGSGKPMDGLSLMIWNVAHCCVDGLTVPKEKRHPWVKMFTKGVTIENMAIDFLATGVKFCWSL